MRLRGASRSDPDSASGDRGNSCGSLFQPGDKVEVRTDEEGFRGAWHEAVVLTILPTCRRYEVSYVSLLSEEDPSKPLCEIVSRSHLRPAPPPVAGDQVYRLHDHVEAFHNDGWWFGVVSAVLPTYGRYTVSIPTSREEIDFGCGELRPQLLWVSSLRRWIPAKEMKHGKPRFKVGDIVEVSRERENYGLAWFDATIVKVIDGSTFMVEYDSVRSNNELLKEILDIQYMRPGLLASSLAKDFTLGDEIEVHVDHGWSAGIILEVVDDAEYMVKLKRSEQELKFDCSEMRYPRFWTGFRWVFQNKKASKRSSIPQSKSCNKGVVAQEHNADMSSTKWTKTQKLSKGLRSEGTVVSKSTNGTSSELVDSIEFGRASVILTGLEIGKHSTIPTVEDGSSMEEQEHSESPTRPKPHGLVHRHNISNVNYISQLLLSNQELPVSIDGSTHVAETLEDNDSLAHIEHSDFIPIAWWSNSKCSWASKVTVRKRSRRCVVRAPKKRKLAFDVGSKEQSQNQIIGTKRDRPQDMCVSDMSKFDQCVLDEPENSLVPVESGDRRTKDYLNLGVLGVLPESDDTNTSTTSTQVGPVQDACLTPHLESLASSSVLMNSLSPKPSDVRCFFKSKFMKSPIFCNSPENALMTFENQTIASPYEDISFATVMPKDPTVTKSPQVLSIENQSASLDPQSSALPPKKTALPFVKSSLLWESIESMDIFNKIPQDPHFSHLEQYSINFREGMAIGLMISFANLVSSIEKLSIGEDPTSIEAKLESLEALEANGFNVSCIRMRLEELLQLQVSRAEYESKKAMLEGKMAEIRNNCDIANATITSYDEAIEVLEGNIASIREKKDSVMRLKESRNSVIVKFRREAREAEEICHSLAECFITKLATLW